MAGAGVSKRAAENGRPIFVGVNTRDLGPVLAERQTPLEEAGLISASWIKLDFYWIINLFIDTGDSLRN